jgi:hypothetical protein
VFGGRLLGDEEVLSVVMRLLPSGVGPQKPREELADDARQLFALAGWELAPLERDSDRRRG